MPSNGLLESSSSIPMFKEDIGVILSLDKVQLYSLLGAQVLGTDISLSKSLFSEELEAVQKRGPIYLDFESSKLKGRGWLKDHIHPSSRWLRKLSAMNLHYCKDEKPILNDLTVVLAALVPVIATGLGIPAATAVTVGVLFAKYYGRVLCECPESSSGEN